MIQLMINYFERYREYLTAPLSVEDYNNIKYYCSKAWYLHLLKQYNISILLIILKYYEEQENYKTCNNIATTITDSNKFFGTNYPLNLSDIIL